MKIPTWFSSIAILSSLVGGVLYAEDRLNQSDEVLSISERIRLHSIEAHSYHLSDLGLRIAYLGRKQERNQEEEWELNLYEERKEQIKLILERLGRE